MEYLNLKLVVSYGVGFLFVVYCYRVEFKIFEVKIVMWFLGRFFCCRVEWLILSGDEGWIVGS